ncbi:thiamine diphosphokinase [Marinibacterium profundimaris]|uniref:Thiamine diphosphokinase n=1 Tax=Marinibacterium profundimaris TaxID=1679460 RepID=A0A225NK33_9RHOB|nr:thiamine diphosphokinase [Marinibacterium profundimaris]OWU72591.1 thiamine pyrophosphokinase [Marinibacterium profundimaris]
MTETLVETPDLVTLVGGGDVSAEDLDLALSHAPVLVAADSGADAALAQGRAPVAVIGDLDSLSDRARATLGEQRLHHLPEQESTDFDKALRSIAAPMVLAVGFLGARVDHQLAVFNVLVRRADLPCVLIGPEEVVFAAPPAIALALALEAGDVVSLFPMRQVTGRSSGLTWPIEGLDFAPDGRVGTSNRADGAAVLEFDGPGMLVILPRNRLETVITALASPQAPSRAR